MPMINEVTDDIANIYRDVYNTNDFIPLHSPYFSGNEKKYINDCIDSTWVSSVGKYVDHFAEKITQYCKCKYAVPTVNGTAALHLSLLAAGVTAEDHVICPDISFIATAAAIAYTGASIAFLDIDEDTLGLSPQALETYLKNYSTKKNNKTIHKYSGKQIKACVAMHNIGFPLRITEIKKICEKNNIILIEDAAEALGSSTNHKKCGTFGQSGIFSFNGNKPITTGGGGILITDNEKVYTYTKHLSTTAKKPHKYLYVHTDIGYNYRMPNINAALGLAQFEKFNEMITIKRKQFETIKKNISNKNIKILTPPFGEWNYWFVIAKISNVNIFNTIEKLSNMKIMARPLWSKISEMEPYKNQETFSNPIAEKITQSIICLPNGVAFK